MLKKLMKHEFRATYKMNLSLYVAVIGITVVSSVLINITKSYYNILTNMILSGSYIIYFISLGALSLMPCIFAVYRFYKNLVTDEGYLSFTLPVTASQQIISKLLVSFIWYFGAFLIGVGSYAVFFVSVGDFDLSQIVEFFKVIPSEAIPHLIGYLAELLLLYVSGILGNITVLYLCIAIGQMFFKNKLLGSIAVFAIYYVASQAISMVFVVIMSFAFQVPAMSAFIDVIISSEASIHVFLIGSSVFNIIYLVAAYFVTDRILSRRLNLA